MKKVIALALLSMATSAPAMAAGDWTGSIGGAYGLGSGDVGIQGEYNLEPSLRQPVSVQAFYKNYSLTQNYFGVTYSWSLTALGVAGIYDLNRALEVSDRKLHPFAGAGLYNVNATFTTNVPGWGGTVAAPASGGLYLTLGARYDVTPQVNVEGGWNSFSGLAIAANFKF